VPTVTQTFFYSGTLNQVAIPAGTTTIDMYLWGGGGGGGGSDRHAGGVGAAGHHVKKTGYDVTSNIGDTLTIAVGGGGGGGSSGQGAPGGANGKSITGFSGGVGGQSGTARPYSGAGGGGGGASVIKIGASAIAVAGGGGGAGGGGAHSGGASGINSNSATGESPATLGENGAGHVGDGGGGGAGGGGAAGGKGGSGASGDNGGGAGFAGSNTVPSSGSSDDGSGTSPGGTSESFYSSGIAIGGASSGGVGGDGKVVVVFNISVTAKVKVGGTYKDVNNIFYKVSGTWKTITAAYFKVSGTYKALFNSGVEFAQTAAGFGDSSGNSTSGTTGSGGGGCFVAGTLVTMADGTQKAIEQIELKDQVSVGGKVFATAKFLIDNLYDYKGVKVSGTHMVKEDGIWTRVQDTKHGVSLGNDEHVVYVFGSENRRIIINGIEFTDYFELTEQQELVNHGEGIFDNWQNHDRQIHDKNVNILNA